jgi:hypothetical protein
MYNIHAYFSGPMQSMLEAANLTRSAANLTESAANLTQSVEPEPEEQRRTAEGDALLKRIARAGKQWKKTVGRNSDMEGELNSFFFFLSQTFD